MSIQSTDHTPYNGRTNPSALPYRVPRCGPEPWSGQGCDGTVAACHRTSAATGLRPEPTEFVIRLSSIPRGARLARWLTEQQLAGWGIPYGSGTARTIALITAQLASNAVTHGRRPGRDFRLALALLPHAVRIEVTDTRPERLLPNPSPALTDATTGRGLLLVDAYASRWGCTARDACTKTVWAEVRTMGIL